MTLIYLNQQNGSRGGPQVWSSRFQAILEERGFRVTADLGADWASALFVNDTHGMDRAIKTGRPVVYRVANGYLPDWFKQVGREMKAQHHLVNSKVAYGLEFANTVIYQSQWAKESLDENFYKRDYGLAIIYNGVDLQRFTPTAKHSSLRIENSAVIGTVGRLRYRYRLETFLEMSRRIEMPHTLLIVGSLDAESRAVLTTYQADPLIGPRISYQAYVPPDELPRLYQSMDIFVHPVCGDVCPNVVVEALACGVPVVTPKFGGSAELVGEAGKVFDCRSWVYDSVFIEAMAGAAISALRDKERLAIRARQRAERLFDLRLMADLYLEAMGLPQDVIATSQLTAMPKNQIRERVVSLRNCWRKIISLVEHKAQQKFRQHFSFRVLKKPRIAFVQLTFDDGGTLELLNYLTDTFNNQYDFYFLETGNYSRPGHFDQYTYIAGPSELIAFLHKQHIDILQINGQRWIVDAALAAGIVNIIVCSECKPDEFPGSKRSISYWLSPIENDLHRTAQQLSKIYRDLMNIDLPED